MTASFSSPGDSRRDPSHAADPADPPAPEIGAKGNAGPAWIAYIDRDERVRFINPAYCRHLRRDRRELLGRPVREVLGEAAYRAARPLLHAALAGQSQQRELRRPLPDGRGMIIRETHWEPAEDESGQVVGCYLVELDVTERNQWESQLLEARRAAEAASEAKSQFVAQMNHEIRTPMAAMLGYVEILARREDDPEKLRMLNTVRRNGDLLTEIINEVLDLAKIEAGKLEIVREQFDLDELLADVHAVMRGRAEEKQIELNIRRHGKIPESIETDPIRLRQILINLMGNAIKFTDEGEVCLTVSNVAGQPARLRFEVADTGIGMTEEQIEGLFVPFAQASRSIARHFGGTGLGLSISQRLAELLGGRIEAASQPGRGSTFACEIEVGRGATSDRDANASPDRSSDRSSVGATAAPRSLAGRCVLVVDDRREARLLVEHFLTEAGANVEFAADGVEALLAVRASLEQGSAVDAVLLDMQMPRLDGYEAATAMRASGFQRPIVALTADAMEQDRKRCLAAGCNAHIRKPVDADELIDVLVSSLQSHARRAAKSSAS